MNGNYGLRNIGNTCFMNSTLQCLRYIKKLTEYLLQKPNINYHKSPVTFYYKNLLYEFNKIKNDSYSNYYPYTNNYIINYLDPSNLKIEIEKKHSKYKGSQQHDSAEFFSTFLTILNEENNDNYTMENTDTVVDKNFEIEKKTYYSQNKTIISDLFVIFTKIDSNPPDQNFPPEFDETYYIDLPIISNGYLLKSIEECLNNYQKPQKIEGSYPGYEVTKICSTSDIFALNLRRVFEGKHISHFVKYPEKLDLKNYSLNYDKKSTVYQLIGIIKHIGDERSGHKIALCRDQSGIWHKYNDREHDKLQNPPLNEDLVFLLIYQRISDDINLKEKNNKVETIDSKIIEFEKIISNNKLNIKEIERNYQKIKNENQTIINNFYKEIYEKTKYENKNEILIFFDNNGIQKIDQEGYLDFDIFQQYLAKYNISIPQLNNNYIKNNKVNMLKLFKKYEKFIENIDIESISEKDIKKEIKELYNKMKKKLQSSIKEKLYSYLTKQELSSSQWEKFISKTLNLEVEYDLRIALKKMIPKAINFEKFYSLLDKYKN